MLKTNTLIHNMMYNFTFLYLFIIYTYIFLTQLIHVWCYLFSSAYFNWTIDQTIYALRFQIICFFISWSAFFRAKMYFVVEFNNLIQQLSFTILIAKHVLYIFAQLYMSNKYNANRDFNIYTQLNSLISHATAIATTNTENSRC